MLLEEEPDTDVQEVSDTAAAAAAAGTRRVCEGFGGCGAAALLAKHEQKPPGAEQPIAECRGGEEQGAYGDLFVTLMCLLAAGGG